VTVPPSYRHQAPAEALVGQRDSARESIHARTTSGSILVLHYGQIRPDGRAPQNQIDDLMGGFLDQFASGVGERREGQFDGRPAVEIRLKHGGTTGQVRARATIDGPWVYLQVAIEASGHDDSEADAFFRAFRIH